MTPNDISKLLPYPILIPDEVDDLIRKWQVQPRTLGENGRKMSDAARRQWDDEHHHMATENPSRALENMRALAEIDFGSLAVRLAAVEREVRLRAFYLEAPTPDPPFIKIPTLSTEHIGMMRDQNTRCRPKTTRGLSGFSDEFLKWVPGNIVGRFYDGAFPFGVWTGPRDAGWSALGRLDVFFFENDADGFAYKIRWE